MTSDVIVMLVSIGVATGAMCACIPWAVTFIVRLLKIIK